MYVMYKFISETKLNNKCSNLQVLWLFNVGKLISDIRTIKQKSEIRQQKQEQDKKESWYSVWFLKMFKEICTLRSIIKLCHFLGFWFVANTCNSIENMDWHHITYRNARYMLSFTMFFYIIFSCLFFINRSNLKNRLIYRYIFYSAN